MKAKRTKRSALKPVKAWAVVKTGGIMIGRLFGVMADAVWLAAAYGGRVVRVEIREIRRTKR